MKVIVSNVYSSGITASPILLDKVANGGVSLRDGGAEVLHIRDSTNARGFNLTLTASGDQTIATSGGDLILNPSANLQLKNGKNFIGGTSDANVTVGLSINQAGNDDRIITLKSSDIAHGVTSVVETNTYGAFSKGAAATGGINMLGFSSGTGGMALTSVHTTDNTTKSTAATGAIALTGFLKNGTTVAAIGANGNIVTISDGGAVRFILDAEGSGHADVEWVTYDAYDDLALISDMETTLINRESFEQTDRRHMLEQAGIIGKDSWHTENGRPRAMVNMTKLAMLHHGALMQVNERIKALEARLWLLEAP